MKKRMLLRITGQVQGVFFRAFTRRSARELGLKGYVRNMPDGSVEVLAEGEQGSLEQLLESCHKGPSGAMVSGVQVTWSKHLGEFSGFDVI